MENTRNPGTYAIGIGVALTVLFAMLGITGVLSGQIGFGLAGLCLIVSALLYIMYTRGNPVAKTGFGALIVVIAIGLIMPVLFVNQQQAQANETSQQYRLTLQRGAAIFGQYCATCHGFQGQGINGPQLNNNPAVNKMADADLQRIIDAGIPGDPSNPTVLAMPAWLNTYGGGLTDDDIGYLIAFIRSSDPGYLEQKNLPNINGFSYVLGTLTTQAQITAYNQQLKSGGKPTDFQNETGKTKVAVQIVNTPNSTIANWGFSPPDIIVSPGTTVTWTNVSNFIHTVVTRPGTNPPANFASAVLSTGGGTFSFTFTKPGDYPYYCSIHPAMHGWVEVK